MKHTEAMVDREIAEALTPLLPEQCWEVAEPEPEDREQTIKVNSTLVVPWAVVERAIEESEPFSLVDFALNQGRSLINNVIRSGGCRFKGHNDYISTFRDFDDIAKRFTVLPDPEHLAISSINDLTRLIQSLREQDFARQLEELNRYIEEDHAPLWVKISSLPRTPGRALMVLLRGFYLSSENGEAVPALILEGQDGGRGQIPEKCYPETLYVERPRGFSQ